jgi:hypothetical protein
MDTKELLAVLEDNNIDLDQDDRSDAESAWIEAMIASWDDFQDTWLDYAEAIPDEELKKMHGFLKSADHDMEYVSSYKHSRDLIRVYMAAANNNLARFASFILENHREQVTRLVEDNSDMWMADCIGYKSDCMEGQREDYLYEQAKDRKLDGVRE